MADECIFCSIISGEIQSYKILEDETALAVLEINPVSKGHILVIPKEHTEEIQEDNEFVKEISEKVKTKLAPKEVIAVPSNLQGHSIINLIPIYEDTGSLNQRYKAKPEELEKIQKILKKESEKKETKKTEKPKPEIVQPKIEKIDGKISLPKRIP